MPLSSSKRFKVAKLLLGQSLVCVSVPDVVKETLLLPLSKSRLPAFSNKRWQELPPVPP